MKHLDVCKKCENLFKIKYDFYKADFMKVGNSKIKLCQCAQFCNVKEVVNSMEMLKQVTEQTEKFYFDLLRKDEVKFYLDKHKQGHCPYIMQHQILDLYGGDKNI